jgi:hypothetical protein
MFTVVQCTSFASFLFVFTHFATRVYAELFRSLYPKSYQATTTDPHFACEGKVLIHALRVYGIYRKALSNRTNSFTVFLQPNHTQQYTAILLQQHQSAFSVVSAGTKSLIRATPMARQALPCVHEGFLEVYSHVRKQILQCVLEVLQRQFDKAIKRAKSRSRQKQRSQQGDHQRFHDVNDTFEGLILPKIYVSYVSS